MLRHYDKIELLKPTAINDNGYRVYSSSQIETISKIKKYRSCQFSLTEIGELLELNSVEHTKQLATRKLTEMQEQDHVNQATLKMLIELSNATNTNVFHNFYDVSLTQRQKVLVLTTKSCYGEERVESKFNLIYDFIQKKQVSTTGLNLLLVDTSKDTSFKVAVPIGKKVETSIYESVFLNEGCYLSTFHYGDYSNIGMAYDNIYSYAKENNIDLDLIFLERYFLDSIYTPCPTEYITEISVKIK